MTLEFTHLGQTRTLVKHPRVAIGLRRGTISEETAKCSPWYLRLKISGKSKSFRLATATKQAISDARDILNGRHDKPNDFSAWLDTREARRGVTLGTLAADWIAAGCPFDGVATRTAAAAEPLREGLTRALPFWSARRVLSVTHHSMTEFVVWRRQHVRNPGGTAGSRSADLELAALSSLCRWAVLTDRIANNPFAKRTRFHQKADIHHCHQAMPGNDEQFHRILSWFWDGQTDPVRVTAGAWLAFTALTGLRPGEPARLLRVQPATEFPSSLPSAPLGLIYPVPDGSRRMRIARLKRGQNPAIAIHSALDAFLRAWGDWLESDGQDLGEPLFPISQGQAAERLERACRDLKLPKMKPHGFGRAYYVRVRRSQGADDATIAVELGQSSNGDLIRSVYGDPGDGVGGNLYDWLPKDGPPAWELLRPATTATNIIRL